MLKFSEESFMQIFVVYSKKDEPPPAADKPADVSALSEESHNVSATLPNDMTMDSIRDYT